MKFLCDRCKTRYSIGDERVRGKILKIRCKNCANVITVREGMPDGDAAPIAGAGVPRRNKTTTAAPVVTSEAPVGAGDGKGALGAAFASAMTKPPPALEEEWYVSIDGDQSGPFSLGEAQRWVANKPFDAELHCWSEGFDDWLPVDKVSHFRGLRKKPAPAPMPPPLPRVGTGPARAITAQAPRVVAVAAMPPKIEEEPKPLFAATMASLEKSVPTAMSSGGGMATAAAVQARPAATPVTPGAKPAPYVNGGTARGAALPAVKPALTTKGIGLAPVGAPKPSPFDAGDVGATNVSAPAFTDSPPQAEPAWPAAVRADKVTGPNDAFLDAMANARGDQVRAPTAPTLSGKELSLGALAKAKPFEMPPEEPESDDLDIGEVSRVVNLADIVRPPKAAAAAAASRTGAVARTGQPGVVGRVSGSVPKINGTAPVPLIAAVDIVPSGTPMPAAITDAPAVAVKAASRRGMIVLIIAAVMLVGAAAVVVIQMTHTPDDVTGLGGQFEYNGQRPDDPIARRPGDPGQGTNEPPPNPFIPKPPRPYVRPQTPVKVDPPQPAGNSLRSDEIEAMARSTSGTTTACFRRADKGADAIRLADVKKIRVSFKVMPDGSVAANSVDLSEKSSATLTSCIQRMIGGWKFRPNSGGDFGFVFAKPG